MHKWILPWESKGMVWNLRLFIYGCCIIRRRNWWRGQCFLCSKYLVRIQTERCDVIYLPCVMSFTTVQFWTIFYQESVQESLTITILVSLVSVSWFSFWILYPSPLMRKNFPNYQRLELRYLNSLIIALKKSYLKRYFSHDRSGGALTPLFSFSFS